MTVTISKTNQTRIAARLSFGELKQLIVEGLAAKAGFVPGRDDVTIEQFHLHLKPRGGTFTIACDVVLSRDDELSKANAH